MKTFVCCLAALMIGCWPCRLNAYNWFGIEQTKEFKQTERRVRQALQNRQWNEALTVLEQSRRRFTHSVKIRFALAYLYRQVGLFSQAREHIQWCVRQSCPGDSCDLALRESAWIAGELFLYEEALDALGRINHRIEADWALEGRLRAAKGEWPAALEAFNHLSTDRPSAAFWKGWCLWRLGRFHEARAYFAKAAPVASARLFERELAASEPDPWVVLGHAAGRRLAGEQAALPGKLAKKNLNGDTAGADLLERLSKGVAR
ncbi:MAG: tetratricopeptide repeat protein [Elusimicrobia bacterium]|nr:tetratricopeptide repeat protein [Elusimicrobiota bacterium]